MSCLLLYKDIRWLVNETQFWSELQENFRSNIDKLLDEDAREEVLHEIILIFGKQSTYYGLFSKTEIPEITGKLYGN